MYNDAEEKAPETGIFLPKMRKNQRKPIPPPVDREASGGV